MSGEESRMMDIISLDSDSTGDGEAEEVNFEGDCAITEHVGQNDVIQGGKPMAPAVGMEFESYEDIYYVYSCYAKEHGFGVRINNTWYNKRKEKYRGLFSCSSAGFTKKSKSNCPKPETRTGCPAMIKVRLMDNKRWRIIEVELVHNHFISPSSGKVYKSHKRIGLGNKRSLETSGAEDIQKLHLCRTVLVDTEHEGEAGSGAAEFENVFDKYTRLKLRQGDAQAIHIFFCRMQLLNPNFVYLMDLNEGGCLRNLFWADARSRAAFYQFSDVVMIDITCLTYHYEVPLVTFVGVNNHMQPISFGCGLVASETTDSFVWLLRAWLTYMLGRTPRVIVTDQSKSLETAIAVVLPRAFHCFSLSHIMHRCSEKLEGFRNFELLKMAFSTVACCSLRIDEFETACKDMIHHYEVGEHLWLRELYEDRKRWVPVYLKETFLVGILPLQESPHKNYLFAGYLLKDTSLKEFLEKYEQALVKKHQEEDLADKNSGNPSATVKCRFPFELQLSKLYTSNVLGRFRSEVDRVHLCSIIQKSVEGPVATYIVKEQVEVGENILEGIDYEVLYNKSEEEVICICGLFNLKGYLCRHALVVLSQNMEQIPAQYILARWRKDIKHSYLQDYSCTGTDISNPVHRYDHLYRSSLQVVEHGKRSHDRYKVAIQELNEILKMIHLVDDHQL